MGLYPHCSMEYQVIKSNRKTLAIEIKPDGNIVVKAPMRTSKLAIDYFVKQHEGWIQGKLQKMALGKEVIGDVSKMTEQELDSLKKKARKLIIPLVEDYAEIMGVTYGQVSIRAQKTRWGSCSFEGNLNFNCLLALCPEGVMRYVVVHELCHRKHMNHSKAFWSEVSEYMPDYKEQRAYLKKYGTALMARLP